MGKTVALDPATLAWARDRFREYYASERVEPPPDLARREFAAFPFTVETLMRRHAAFRSAEEFSQFLPREAPRHVYYSSAYYRYPDRPNMALKEWLGADLIFDLDADHLKDAARLDYAGQLARVKEKLTELVDDFLVGDLGVSPSATTIVFSGGRGYHVHVRSPEYRGLTSPERREIVDYVLGQGFDPHAVVQESREVDRGAGVIAGPAAEEGTGRNRPRPMTFRRLAPRDAPGWRGRMTRAVDALLARWDRDGVEVAKRELLALGLPEAKARALAKKLVNEGRGRQIRETGSLEVFRGEVPEELLKTVIEAAHVEVQGETDAPVTTDIHRLIRLPGSLHGGTGFRVVPLDRGALDRFDPWRDAVAARPNGDRVEIETSGTVQYPFADRPLDLAAGATAAVPTSVGLFLVLRGEATLRSGPAR